MLKRSEKEKERAAGWRAAALTGIPRRAPSSSSLDADVARNALPVHSARAP